ncbi:unnamed protein product [Gadus morhua 'NCC']
MEDQQPLDGIPDDDHLDSGHEELSTNEEIILTLVEEPVHSDCAPSTSDLENVNTGFLPYASGQWWINDRVAVPEYIWSAYCCPSYNGSLPRGARPFFPSYAAVGRNDRDSMEEIVPVDPTAKGSVQGYDMRRLPLADLEEVQRQRLAPNVSLFQGCAGPPPVVPPVD